MMTGMGSGWPHSPAVKKQREMNAGLSQHSPLYLVGESSPLNGAACIWVALPSLINPVETLSHRHTQRPLSGTTNNEY